MLIVVLPVSVLLEHMSVFKFKLGLHDLVVKVVFDADLIEDLLFYLLNFLSMNLVNRVNVAAECLLVMYHCFIVAFVMVSNLTATVEAKVKLARVTTHKILSFFSLLNRKALWAFSALFKGRLGQSYINFLLSAVIVLEL